MGSSYSDLKVYLLCKSDCHGNNKYDITTTTKVVDDCRNFEVVTHTIKFNPPANGIYYNVLLYEDDKEKYPGKYVFGYYYPGHKHLVVQEVYVYFSIFAPREPLVITFKLTDNNKLQCTYRQLKSAGWDYASKMSRNTSPGDLNTLLKSEYEKLYSNKTIGFELDKEIKKGVLHQIRKIGSEEYIMNINTPFGTSAELGKTDLLKEVKPAEPNQPAEPTKPTEPKNQIDSSYFSSLSKKYFDGIIIYNNKEGMALLLEFYRECETKQIVRKDKEGTYWADEKFDYSDYKTLESKLKELESSSKGNDIVTYMLNKTSNYNNITIESKSHKAYTKNEHKSNEFKRPNLLFDIKPIKINNYDANKELNTLEVYYLKVKTDKGEELDKTPFLVVFNEKNGEPKKKIYYFNKTNLFTDWHEFLTNDLEQKLQKIDDDESCIGNLNILRNITYDILSSKEYVKPEPAPKPPPPGTRPKPDDVLVVPQVTNWNLIIGLIITAIILLIIISAGIYGIYWYNTTIKLLT